MPHHLRGFEGTKRYVPRRLLGAGGMGAVYEVDDRVTGGLVALKLMLDDDAGRLLRFKQEFRMMAELHHPNLVRLFDLGQHEGRWFFTMELVHGQDLMEVLLQDGGAVAGSTSIDAAYGSTAWTRVQESGERTASLELAPISRQRRVACDPDALIRVVAQTLDALEFLHARGIIHRDLKPSNILVDEGGAVRVLDFGLASRVDRAAAISAEGAVVGTLAYLSPEQYRGSAASAASDLYALGVMMFQLLTGELPFQGAPMEALAARVERPPPRVEERVQDAPPALAEVIHRLMAMDPPARPSIDEVRAALGIGRRASLPPAQTGKEPSAEVFVGRRQELAVLGGCFDRAASGQAQIALVSGPSGIGKSALASKAMRRAERQGFLCFEGRCYEREQVPFVAFDRVVDAMTLALRKWPAARLAALRPSLLVLQRIFPALGVLTGAARSEASGVDPRELRRQALDGFRQLCIQCQAEAPLCFVLDDLQWADEESVTLLSEVLVGGSGRIMVLGLLRPEGIDAHHPLDPLLRRVRGLSSAVSLPIAALEAGDARRLVETVTAGRLDARTSDALAEQADGNPFLLVRLCEHVSTLAPGEQTARLDAVGSATDLLRQAISTLSPRAEQVLAIAATAGSDIAAPLLRATSDLGSADFDLAVGELSAGRFFKTVRAADGAAEVTARFDVYHDRIREVAYRSLAADRRRALHRSLAEAIEAQPEGDALEAEVLARHWGEADDRDRKRRYAVLAAEQAEGKLAFVRAARLFRAVLDDPEPGEEPLATAARWERVGHLFEYGGLRLDAARAFQEAQRRWDAAPEHHPDRAVARLRLRALAGANLMATPHVGEGRAVFEDGLALLGRPLERPLPERLAVLASLKARAELAERLDGFVGSARDGTAIEWIRERLPRASDAEQQLLAAEVRFLDLLVLAFQVLWIGPAAEAALRSELLGRRIDDQRVRVRSLAGGASAPVFLFRCTPRQIERAHRRLDAADALVRALDVPLGRELVQLNRSIVWMATSTARARATCEAALEGVIRRGMIDSFDGDIARAYYLYVLIFKGDEQDALAWIERQLAVQRVSMISSALFHGEKVVLLARRGQLDAARETLAELDAQLEGLPPSRLTLSSMRGLAHIRLAEGRFDEVLAVSRHAERVEREIGSLNIGLNRSLKLDLDLNAALGLSKQGRLSAEKLRAARRSAAWLAREGVFDFTCLGHRALALFDHAEGHRARALDSLSRALLLSTTNTSPRHRWLCLEAARDLGVITLDQEDEAAALARSGGFSFEVP